MEVNRKELNSLEGLNNQIIATSLGNQGQPVSIFHLFDNVQTVENSAEEEVWYEDESPKRGTLYYVKRSPIFEGQIETAKDLCVQEVFLKEGIEVFCYQSSKGQERYIVQQATDFSCGIACVFMAFLDRYAEKREIEYPNSFISLFFNQEGLTNAKLLATIARKYAGITLSQIKFTKEQNAQAEDSITVIPVTSPHDIIENLKVILDRGSKVIQAITHPKIYGHWILIDEYVKDTFYIRDPYTALAYALDAKDLSSMLLDGIQFEWALEVQ